MDMIAIGGGGTATDKGEGALLTASYPNDDLSGWIVSSKDHIKSCVHDLVTYVIGMKIAGMDREQLKDAVYISIADSGIAQHPEAETSINSDYVLLGGGFRVDWKGEGNLATASFPYTQSSWKARSKDHIKRDPSNIRVFAIGLKKDLPVGQVVNTIGKANSSRYQHPAAVADIEPGFVLTGGGAEVHWNGEGNLLWKLEPSTSTTQSFSVASKDHIKYDPSTITAFALGIKLL